jgi:hypothetical protein
LPGSVGGGQHAAVLERLLTEKSFGGQGHW